MNTVDSTTLIRYARGMRRWLILLGMLVAGATEALRQGSSTSPAGVNYVSSAPSGSCVAGSVMQVLTTGAGTVYACQSITAGVGTWTALSSAGSTGTVTSFTLNGTANQITATGGCAVTVSGTCTLSLPSALTIPGTINGVTIPSSVVWPVTLASTSHKWVNSFTQSTGTFTATQPASTDLSDYGTVSFSGLLGTPSITVAGLTDTAMTGGPFCVHETSGVNSATTADCGVGGGTFSGLNTTGANGINP